MYSSIVELNQFKFATKKTFFEVEPIIMDNMKQYIFEKDNIKFSYIDLSNIFDEKYKDIEQIFNILTSEIHDCQNQFVEDNMDEMISDNSKYDIMVTLGLIDDITFDNVNKFFQENSIIDFLNNTNDLKIKNKVETFIDEKLKKLGNNNDNVKTKIKELFGIIEKKEINKDIIKKIKKIYSENDVVFIFIATGSKTLINKKMLEDLIINKKKIAIIYISELSNHYPPFWLSKTTSSDVLEVSQ